MKRGESESGEHLLLGGVVRAEVTRKEGEVVRRGDGRFSSQGREWRFGLLWGGG